MDEGEIENSPLSALQGLPLIPIISPLLIKSTTPLKTSSDSPLLS